MMIKFLKHGNGSCRDAVDYLLSDKDHKGTERPSVSVLRGDPYLTSDIADSIEHRKKYTSCVVAWSPEDQPELEEISHFLDEFEQTAFAGLEADQFSYTAVLHTEENGGVHLHIINAACDLYTGKSLNIAPPGWMKTFDPLRDYFNHHYGWLRPDDPDLKRAISTDQAETYQPRGKKELTETLLTLVADGQIGHAGDIRFWLNNWGFEITRQGESKRGPYLSLKDKDSGEKIRLTGDIYGLEWTVDDQCKREDRAKEKRDRTSWERRDPEAATGAWIRLEKARSRRTEYNRKRYQKKPEIRCLGVSEYFSDTWSTLGWPEKFGDLERHPDTGNTKFDAGAAATGGTDPAGQSYESERDDRQGWSEMEVHPTSGHSTISPNRERPRKKLSTFLDGVKNIANELAFWRRWRDTPDDYVSDEYEADLVDKSYENDKIKPERAKLWQQFIPKF